MFEFDMYAVNIHLQKRKQLSAELMDVEQYTVSMEAFCRYSKKNQFSL